MACGHHSLLWPEATTFIKHKTGRITLVIIQITNNICYSYTLYFKFYRHGSIVGVRGGVHPCGVIWRII